MVKQRFLLTMASPDECLQDSDLVLPINFHFQGVLLHCDVHHLCVRTYPEFFFLTGNGLSFNCDNSSSGCDATREKGHRIPWYLNTQLVAEGRSVFCATVRLLGNFLRPRCERFGMAQHIYVCSSHEVKAEIHH